MSRQCSKMRIKAAREMQDFSDFLMENHGEYFIDYPGSIHLRENQSLAIKKGYSGYHDFSTGEHGNPIDFLVNYLGYEFTDAVYALTEDFDEDDDYDSPIKGRTSAVNSVEKAGYFEEKRVPNGLMDCPEMSSDNSRMLAYLQKTRKLEYRLFKKLLGGPVLMYQDKLGNIIFENEASDWAEMRGTCTFADKRCKHCVNGKCLLEGHQYRKGEHGWCLNMGRCDRYKANPFHGIVEGSREDGFWCFKADPAVPDKYIFICEAAIDALSLHELRWRQYGSAGIKGDVYVSIGGAGKHRTIERIRQETDCQVVIAVDRDEAGDECRNCFSDLRAVIPLHKDWNDDLKSEKA